MLQWVHGPRTVVMLAEDTVSDARLRASMGPRSENRGYGPHLGSQGVHGGGASMGPRSENRGYAVWPGASLISAARLQWVHGPRTVVMVGASSPTSLANGSFNGSTVREPWLW